jgi:hypothetical protein
VRSREGKTLLRVDESALDVAPFAAVFRRRFGIAARPATQRVPRADRQSIRMKAADERIESCCCSARARTGTMTRASMPMNRTLTPCPAWTRIGIRVTGAMRASAVPALRRGANFARPRRVRTPAVLAANRSTKPFPLRATHAVAQPG